MNPSVYVETSIVSYLSARPSRDVVIAAHQQLTAAMVEGPALVPVVRLTDRPR